jgi:ribose 1,5-bisphosphokinase
VTMAPTPPAQLPLRVGPGRLILVIGPSGAGKDTLLKLAKAACDGDPELVFARRVVTREASAFEDNEHLTVDAFKQAAAAGMFAVHWVAHGHCYGLPRTIEDNIRTGRTVVANVSRTVVTALRNAYPKVVVIMITAPPEVIAERLIGRSRDSDGNVEHRLGRVIEDAPVADITITNAGPAEDGARELLRILKGS